MGNLSPHFSRSEFACPCGCGFENVDYELISNMEELADELLASEPTAKRVAVHVNSGNRCKAYDRAMKIKNNVPPKDKPSEHLRGWAMDFWAEWVAADGIRTKISDDYIVEQLQMKYVGRHGVGRYHGRTHYDTRTDGPARWDTR